MRIHADRFYRPPSFYTIIYFFPVRLDFNSPPEFLLGNRRILIFLFLFFFLFSFEEEENEKNVEEEFLHSKKAISIYIYFLRKKNFFQV